MRSVFFNDLPIRLKFALPMIAALSVMLISIYIYVPEYHKRTLLHAYKRDALRMTEFFAEAVSTALEEHDFKLVQKSIQSAKIDANVLFIVLYDDTGEQLAVFNPKNRALSARKKIQGIVMEGEKSRMLIGQLIVSSNKTILGHLLLAYSLEEINRQIANFHLAILIFTFVAFLLGSLFIHAISGHITRSISDLQKQMQHIVDQQTYESTIQIDSKDEVGRLAEVFNKMMHEIDLRQKAILKTRQKYLDLYENAPTMYFNLDPTGKILDCNKNAIRALGLGKKQVLYANLGNFLKAAGHTDWDSLWKNVISKEGAQDIELQLKCKDDTFLDVLLTSSCQESLDQKMNPMGQDPAQQSPYTVRVTLSDISHLKKFERQIIKRNEELARLYAQLKKANKKLKELDRLKTKFVSDASHQLRTPLTIIKGEVEIVLRKNRKPREYRESLSIVQDEVEDLERIVENLLTLARADSGNLVSLEEMVDFSAVCEEQVLKNAVFAKTKNISVDYDIQSRCWVLGDPLRLGQLVSNLI
ncbi:MAG: HAMP domain-containing protein, partial [Calditrichaeota bacterium]